jgi:hypothetical protein
LFDGSTWTVVQNWTTSNTFAWTPTSSGTGYRVGVWIRNAGNTTDAYDNPSSNGSIPFSVSGGTTSGLVMTSLTANPASPKPVGTPVTFTAVATGGTAPYQYKWWLFDGSSWTVVQNWTTSNTFAWTPTAPGTGYRVGVWIRNAGSTADAYDNSASNGSIGFSVSSSSSSLWPNEPVGLIVRTDWGLDQTPPTAGDVAIPGAPGWKVVSNSSTGSAGGWVERVSDRGAPLSSSNVYDFVYPQGMIEGEAPATVYYNNLGASEVYAGFWWKPSSPFDTGPNGNKIAFLFNGGGDAGGQQFLILLPDGRLRVLPEYPGDFQWRHPNVNTTVVTLGQWHKIEWYASKAGTLKWWLDDVLQGSYSNVTNSVDFDMFQFSPTWGGNIGTRKSQTDHYWYDHVHLSTL